MAPSPQLVCINVPVNCTNIKRPELGTVSLPMLTANYKWPQTERSSERKLWHFLTQHPSTPQKHDSPLLLTLHCTPKTLSMAQTVRTCGPGNWQCAIGQRQSWRAHSRCELCTAVNAAEILVWLSQTHEGENTLRNPWSNRSPQNPSSSNRSASQRISSRS